MTASAAPTTSPMRAEVVIIAVVVAMAVAALVYVLSHRQQELRSSPVGLTGLQHWLTAGGVNAQSFEGGWVIDPGSIGVLVMPLHDTDPGSDRTEARTQEELLVQQDETDLDWLWIFEKIEETPTLVVLPKWRTGMRLTGIGHPALVVERDRLDDLLQTLTGLPSIKVTYATQVFTSLPYRDATGTELTTQIYAAQLFDGTGCEPIIGQGQRALLASCPIRSSDSRVMVLSDPDLLNNHGLRLGQNALIIRDFLESSAGEGTVLIDYSRSNWFYATDEPILRERSWADLMQFFEPPFLALWLGVGLTLALVLWRSLRRAGPIVPIAEVGGGKMQAITARARLMRLTGQDGAMIGDYATARIAATAARLVGPGHARQIGEEQAFLRFVARRRVDLAERLQAALAQLRALPPTVSAAVAIHHVDDLEQILELIANDT